MCATIDLIAKDEQNITKINELYNQEKAKNTLKHSVSIYYSLIHPIYCE